MGERVLEVPSSSKASGRLSSESPSVGKWKVLRRREVVCSIVLSEKGFWRVGGCSEEVGRRCGCDGIEAGFRSLADCQGRGGLACDSFL